MKTNLHFNSKNYLVLISLTVLIFSSCKKDYTPSKSEALTASNTSNLYSTDGTLTVQLSILPPTTPPSFIANGGTSTVQYQLTSTKALLNVDARFNASYPAIPYALFGGSYCLNYGGTLVVSPLTGFVVPGSKIVTGEIHYEPVDSSTSGTIVNLSMSSLSYLTYENQSYIFNIGNAAGQAPKMCLVNNIAHISFQDPADKILGNGYSEIAEVKLTGDTDWVLNQLPLHLYSWSALTIPNSKILVKSNNVKIETTGKPIELAAGGIAETVLHFTGGFRHTAGKTEVLKLYANVPTIYHNNAHMLTSMQPLNSFNWTDGLGKVIGGSLNANYYKEQTGEAAY